MSIYGFILNLGIQAVVSTNLQSTYPYISELNFNFEYVPKQSSVVTYQYEKYPAYKKDVTNHKEVNCFSSLRFNQATIKTNLKPKPSQPPLSVWRKICFLENQPRQDSSLLGVFLETVVALLITNVADDNLKELLLSKIHWPDGISMKWCSSSSRLHLPHGSILHRAAGSHVLHHVYKKIENAPCYHYYQFILIPQGPMS